MAATRLPPRALGRALFWPSMAVLTPQGVRARAYTSTSPCSRSCAQAQLSRNAPA